MIIDDEGLERAFFKSPEEYFQAVYDRYSGPLFRFLFRFTGNHQSSEEILHDVFIELLNGKFKSVQNGTLKSWLFTVAKNRGLNHRKKFEREMTSDLSSMASSHDLEAETMQTSLLSQLKKIEDRLPNDLQETWNLRKKGLDYQEIAKTLSIPVGTVKSRFSRLVDFLRKEFNP